MELAVKKSRGRAKAIKVLLYTRGRAHVYQVGGRVGITSCASHLHDLRVDMPPDWRAINVLVLCWGRPSSIPKSNAEYYVKPPEQTLDYKGGASCRPKRRHFARTLLL
eukprot:6179180-Pleurochrysis_carterae.AAC.3